MNKSNHSNQLKSAIAWSSIGQIGTQILSFGFGVVLARLLMPSEFGLLAMVTVFTGFAGIFKDLGFGAAIIQKNDIDDMDLSTSFWLNVFIGSVLFAIFYFIAPLIAGFYDNALISSIVKVISINFIITSLSSTHQSILVKKLGFKFKTRVNLIAIGLSSMVGIYFAYLDYGVWSLVIALLVKSVIELLGFVIVVKWIPKFKFNSKSFKTLYSFGSVATFNSILSYFSTNTDNLVIGKLIGDFNLGVYNRAYGIMLLPVRNISGGFKAALFPSLSRIQNDLLEVKRLYLKSTSIVAFVSFPLMFGLSAVAEPFVLFVYGENWIKMIPVLKILSLLGAFSSMMTFNGTIFYSLGKPKYETIIYLVTTPILIIGFIVGANLYGVIGVALSLLIVELGTFFYKLHFVNKLIESNLSEFFLSLKFVLFNTFVMYVVLEVINHYNILGVFDYWLQLLLLSILGFTIYIILSLFNYAPTTRVFMDYIKTRRK